MTMLAGGHLSIWSDFHQIYGWSVLITVSIKCLQYPSFFATLAPMPQREQPKDYNAFGYNPRGWVANMAGLLLGEDWHPDQQDIPCFDGPHIVPPQHGPPADYQQPHLPNNFIPQLPNISYLGALQYQCRQGSWAHYHPPPYAAPPPPYAAPPLQVINVQYNPYRQQLNQPVIQLHSILHMYEDTFHDSSDVPMMYQSRCDLHYKLHFVLLVATFLQLALHVG